MLPAGAAQLASLALLAGVTRFDPSLDALLRYTTDLHRLEPIANSYVELVPRAALSQQEPTLLFDGAYLPRLVARIGSPSLQVLHRASLDLDLRSSPTFHVAGHAGGCYGTNDFALHSATSCQVASGTGTRWTEAGWSGTIRPGNAGTGEPGTTPVEPVPGLFTARYMSALAGLGFDSTLSRRVQVSAGASYLVQGGADAVTRSVLPLQFGPRLTASLQWYPEPREQLTTMLAAGYYAFEVEAAAPRPDAWLLQLTQEWRHSLGPQSLLHVAAGAGAIGDAVDYGRFAVRESAPVAEAAFQQGLGQPGLDLGAGARVAPYVDFTTTFAYERGTIFASMRLPLQRDLRLDASASVGRALDGLKRGEVTGAGQLTLAWLADRWLSVLVIVTSHWQQAAPLLATGSFDRWGVSVGCRMAEPDRL